MTDYYKTVNESLLSGDIDAIIEAKKSERFPSGLSILLDRIAGKDGATPKVRFDMKERGDRRIIKVAILCNWLDPLHSYIATMRYRKEPRDSETDWGRIKVVMNSAEADYIIVLNKSDLVGRSLYSKSLVFHMEPYMTPTVWGDFADISKASEFKAFYNHASGYNNMEWHLSPTYKDFVSMGRILKDESLNHTLSTILSTKYTDPGHKLRTDFSRYLNENMVSVDVYGRCSPDGWKSHKGELPAGKKDKGLFPYKYTFNAENHSIDNYTTEKLVDGILSECLVFYWGNPKLEDLIDERAYVRLPLANFLDDMNTVVRAMEEDLWSQRLPYILEAKEKILNELQLLPRLEYLLR
jgi:hypothetical protein